MTTNAQLTAQMNDLLAQWQVREDEMRAWLAGTADGGPNGDGRYPLTDAEGTTYLVDCPAKLEDMIDGPSAAAGEAAAEAVAAAADALAAVTSAKDAESMANAAKTATLSLKNLVDGQQADVAAKWSDVSTWWSAVSADTATVVAARDITLTYRDEAQAAAAAAQTFDPANYVANTGGTVTGALWLKPNETGAEASVLNLGATTGGSVLFSIKTDDVVGDDLKWDTIRWAPTYTWTRNGAGGVKRSLVRIEGTNPNGGILSVFGGNDDNTVKISLSADGTSSFANGLTVQGRDFLAEIDALEARIAALEAA